MTETVFTFASGSEKIEQDEEARSVRTGGDYVPYWTPQKESGAVHYLRFLTDAPGFIQVAQHSSVQTKFKLSGAKGPKVMSAVCRYDKNFGEDRVAAGHPALYDNCAICDMQLLSQFGSKTDPAKSSNRVWALAVEREQTPQKTFQDVMEEYFIRDSEGKATKNKGLRPKIVVVNMGWSNFFQRLHNQWLFSAMDPAARTILDKDAIIRRSGTGTDTEYDFIMTPATPDLAPGTPAYKVYENELAGRKIDLNEIIYRMSTDEYYARFFDPTKTVDKEGNVVAALPADSAAVFTDAATPAPVVTSDNQAENMEELKRRLTGG